MRPTPVLLDCDPGIDDALAIAYLVGEHLAGRIELVGVVCTAGNVGLPDTVANALAWLELAGAPSIPVCAGAAGATVVPHVFTPETHGPRGAGWADLTGVVSGPTGLRATSTTTRPTPGTTTTTRPVDSRSGAAFWVDVARAHQGELVAIVTGPSSTLAQALRVEPAIPHLVADLVVMGGTFRGHPGNTTPGSEWNVDVDPEAADAVCVAWQDARADSPEVRPPLWCGLNLTEQALWTPAHTDRLVAASDTPLTRALGDALRFYFEFHESVGEGYLAQVHDPFVAWMALHPELVKWQQANVRVECSGTHTRGMTVEDGRSHRGQPDNARIATGIRVRGGPPAVMESILSAITALD